MEDICLRFILHEWNLCLPIIYAIPIEGGTRVPSTAYRTNHEPWMCTYQVVSCASRITNVKYESIRDFIHPNRELFCTLLSTCDPACTAVVGEFVTFCDVAFDGRPAMDCRSYSSANLQLFPHCQIDNNDIFTRVSENAFPRFRVRVEEGKSR